MACIGVNELYLIPGGVGGAEIYLRELLAAFPEIDYRAFPRHLSTRALRDHWFACTTLAGGKPLKEVLLAAE